MSDFSGQDIKRTVQTILLNAYGVSSILHAAAATTALVHHTGTIRTSPGLIVKAAEAYSDVIGSIPVVAGYRYLKYGTADAQSFDTLEVTSDMQAIRRTRDELYRQMCDNFFTFLGLGPSYAKRYVDGQVAQTEGLRHTLGVFFDAVRGVNNSVTDAIDHMRRRTYATRVACEAAMVLLGMAPIAVGVQIGVGLGYAIFTQGITDWGGMEKADIVAMPGRFVAANVTSMTGNLAQEGVDRGFGSYEAFEAARRRAVMNQAGRIQMRIDEIIERAGGKEALTKGAKKEIVKLTEESARIGARVKAEAAGSKILAAAGRSHIRILGSTAGLLFMKDDLKNVAKLVFTGEL